VLKRVPNPLACRARAPTRTFASSAVVPSEVPEIQSPIIASSAKRRKGRPPPHVILGELNDHVFGLELVLVSSGARGCAARVEAASASAWLCNLVGRGLDEPEMHLCHEPIDDESSVIRGLTDSPRRRGCVASRASKVTTSGSKRGQALRCDTHRLGVVVDQEEPPTVEGGALARRPLPAEEVEHDVAAHDETLMIRWRTPIRFWVGYPVFSAPVRGHDRVPPHVGRRLAPLGLLLRTRFGAM